MVGAPQPISKKDLDNRFTYHPPTTEQQALYEDVRSKARSFATFLNRNVPDGSAKSTAISKVDEAVFWANAGIARAEPDPETGAAPLPSGRGPGRPRASAAVPAEPVAEPPAAEKTKRPRRGRVLESVPAPE